MMPEVSEDLQSMVLTKNKRDEFLVEIRKKKNESLIKQKRIKMAHIGEGFTTEIRDIQEEKANNRLNSNGNEFRDEEEVSLSETRKNQLEIIHKSFYEAMNNEAWEDVAKLLNYLRESLVDINDRVPAKAIIEMGIVPHVLHFLNDSFAEEKQLQIEAAWLIANISAGSSEDTLYLINQNCIQIFHKCLKSNNELIHENAMWVLANIVGEDDLSYRDKILQMGTLREIVKQLCRPPKRILYSRTAVWFMSNLLRGDPFPPFEQTSVALTILAQLIHHPDLMTQCYTLLCLIHLTETKDDAVLKEITNFGFIPKLVKLLSHEDEKVSSYALRITGNLAVADSEVTQQLVDNKIFQILPRIIKSRSKTARKEACFILSNILADKFKDPNYIVVNEIMPLIIEKLSDEYLEVRSEAICCVRNFVCNCSLEEMQLLGSQGVIDALLVSLGLDSPKIIKNVLQSLSRIFAHGEQLKKNFRGSNPYVYRVFQNNATYMIENLQTHEDQEIYKLVSSLMDAYFATEIAE